MSRRRIDHRERDRLETLLCTVPIFEAQRISERPFGTLFKIVEALSK